MQRTLEEAVTGLRHFAVLPREQGGLGLSEADLATWYPSGSTINHANRRGHTWSLSTWFKKTGKRGMAGIHDALGLPPRTFPTADEQLARAKAGLYEWAQLPKAQGGLELSDEQLATWYPSRPQIATACRAGYTWSNVTWDKYTGQRGLVGIHDALGLPPYVRPTAAEQLAQAITGLETWAQLPTAQGGLGLDDEQLAAWYPSQTQIARASKAGYTWAKVTWVEHTGQRGMAGIHDALRAQRAELSAAAFLHRFGLAAPTPTATDRSFAR